jgi:hypothetical protein
LEISRRLVTPHRFRACLDALGWSGRGLSALLGVDERQVRRWAKGDYAIPANIAAWLDRLARFHEQNPPPERRQDKPPPAPE